MLTVKDVMTTDLVTLKETESVALARQHYGRTAYSASAHPQRRRALLSDFSRSATSWRPPSRCWPRWIRETINAMEAAIPIRELMTTAMTTVREDTSLREAALLLLELKVGCLPVLSESRLVGIVTEADFIKFVLRVLDKL